MINIEEIKTSCKERRILYPSDLWELCIKHKWYTNGLTEDNNNFFNFIQHFDFIRNKDITTDLIIDIAFDIFQHSSLQEESFSFVMFEVGRICTTLIEY